MKIFRNKNNMRMRFSCYDPELIKDPPRCFLEESQSHPFSSLDEPELLWVAPACLLEVLVVTRQPM